MNRRTFVVQGAVAVGATAAYWLGAERVIGWLAPERKGSDFSDITTYYPELREHEILEFGTFGTPQQTVSWYNAAPNLRFRPAGAAALYVSADAIGESHYTYQYRVDGQLIDFMVGRNINLTSGTVFIVPEDVPLPSYYNIDPEKSPLSLTSNDFVTNRNDLFNTILRIPKRLPASMDIGCGRYQGPFSLERTLKFLTKKLPSYCDAFFQKYWTVQYMAAVEAGQAANWIDAPFLPGWGSPRNQEIARIGQENFNNTFAAAAVLRLAGLAYESFAELGTNIRFEKWGDPSVVYPPAPLTQSVYESIPSTPVFI